jgi:hypothetical protein
MNLNEILILAAIVAMFLFCLMVLDVIMDHYISDKSHKCPNCDHVFKDKEGRPS